MAKIKYHSAEAVKELRTLVQEFKNLNTTVNSAGTAGQVSLSKIESKLFSIQMLSGKTVSALNRLKTSVDKNTSSQTANSKAIEYQLKLANVYNKKIADGTRLNKANTNSVKRKTSAFKALNGNNQLQIKPLKATTGNWTFESNNLQSTGVGSQLRPFNYFDENYQNVIYGTTSIFDIANIEGKDTKIIKVPAFNPKNGLFLFTNFTPFKNENHHFDYSIIMDLYIPKESENKFISLFQTSPTNSNDGDLFISEKGVGIDNEYHGELLTETWYRLGVVVGEYSIKKYINGIFVGEQAISSGRWSVYNTFAGGQDQGFLLFADNDNETAPIFLSSLQLRNYSMNSNEIKQLGDVKSKGIAISNSGIYGLKFENEIKESIVNWDANEIYVYVPSDVKRAIKVSFKLPFGAKSNINSGDVIRFEKSNQQIISVTAQDGISKTDWKVILKIDN